MLLYRVLKDRRFEEHNAERGHVSTAAQSCCMRYGRNPRLEKRRVVTQHNGIKAR